MIAPRLRRALTAPCLAVALLIATPHLHATSDDPLVDRIATATTALLETPRHLELVVDETAAASPFGGAVVVGGAATGTPFEGLVDVILRDGETTLVSRGALPGFGAIDVSGRRARTMSYVDDTVEFEPLVGDLAQLLDADRLSAALRSVEWSTALDDAGAPVVRGTLDPAILAVKRRGGASPLGGNPLEAKVLAIGVECAFGRDGSVASLRFSIDRTDPVAGMLGRQFGRDTDAEAVGATRTLVLRPAGGDLGARAQRVRLELLAALAARESEEGKGGGAVVPANADRQQARPTASDSREAAEIRFRETIARVDADGDGKIAAAEAGDRWDRLKRYDTDRDGFVTLDELLAAYDRRRTADR